MHSVLHEASHFICMSPARRARLDRDAGGTDLEEAAVCYLQILLADELAAVGRARLMRDMDALGLQLPAGQHAGLVRSRTPRTRAPGSCCTGIADDQDRLTGVLRAAPDAPALAASVAGC